MKCVCLKCDHKWLSRCESKPLSCPNCKSYTWAEPKKKKEKK